MLLGKTIVVTGISSGIGARIGELAPALGADVIGVDIKEPTRPLDAFIKADIGSPQGVAEIVADAAAAVRRALQCRGRLRHARRGEDARDQFLWPAALDRSACAAAARGRRRRQRRLDRRLRLARQSRARESVRRGARVSRSRRASRGA